RHGVPWAPQCATRMGRRSPAPGRIGGVTSHGSRRTAVVTGASSGIGAATARALAQEGYAVWCAARRSDRIEALVAEIDGTAVTCDVTSPESVAELSAAVGESLNVLVNSAGRPFGLEPVAEADAESWRSMFDVNVPGLLHVT